MTVCAVDEDQDDQDYEVGEYWDDMSGQRLDPGLVKQAREEEMVEFTRCGSLMRGSLIPWNSSDWMFTPDIAPEEYRMETVEIRSMCSSKVSE